MPENRVLNVSRLRSGAPARDERRRSVRHTVSAVVQIVDMRSGTRLTTRASDLGLGGCYVDTLTPLPAGTEVRLALHRDNTLIELTAKIVYSHPGLGMGIAFIDATPEHRAALEEWLNSLSQTSYAGANAPIHVEDAATARASAPIANSGDVRGSVSRLVNLLLAKGILTDDDAEMSLGKRKTLF